ncbi:uncharacterized protein BX664DRAFT_334964 [Halteromyces radiatus]|uniref:uncharacterized protein n=1 Tax=Halteromyces radiatus TaxID=101107 RepID=UPI002220F814|nr:uncharacterized protein BX664DRAFT_334964 [Halteromyces radiatus]KAI8086123.1 hypothetical protein BX664DRAFT_334964 [Halteromyces radiatus]
MCGRFCCALCTEDLKTKLVNNGLNVENNDWKDQDKFRPRYNVAPRSFVPVVRQNDSGQLMLQTMKWGLVPSFAKTMPDMQPINARDDTLLTGSPMYDRIKSDKRCIVVADGFYEWKKLGNGKKVPYYTRRKDGQLMFFAGLYDKAHPQDWNEPVLYSTIIVTTGPSSFFSFLHDRMPVILDKKEAYQWLDRSIRWSNDLIKLMKPFQGELDCYQVTDKVGPVSNESSDFILPVDTLKGSISSFFGKQPETSSKKRSSPNKDFQQDIAKKIKTSPTSKTSQEKQQSQDRKHITNFFKQK